MGAELFFILTATLLAFAGLAALRGHHVLAMVNVLLVFYELTGLALYFYPALEALLAPGALRLYIGTGRMSPLAIDEFLLLLTAFFVALNLAYLVAARRVRRSAYRGLPAMVGSSASPTKGYASVGQNSQRALSSLLVVHSVVLLVAGVLAYVTGQGTARAQDYLNETLGVLAAQEVSWPSRLFSYAGALLTSHVVLIIWAAAARDRLRVFLALGLMMPLCYELFLTSRRQLLTPSVLALLCYVLYSRRVRMRMPAAIGLILMFVLLFSAQFGVRNYVTARSEGRVESLADVLAPQLGEFVAIGATSFQAVQVGDDGFSTGGLHLLSLGPLNTIPYLRLGDRWFEGYNEAIRDRLRRIAPFGGLSMIADAYLAGREIAVVALGGLLGIGAWHAHRVMVRWLSDARTLDVAGVYWISVSVLCISKYRSGLSDVMASCVGFTFLFIATTWLATSLQRAVGRAALRR